MLGALLLGFVLGMKHALDADHVAAVAALGTGTASVSDRVKLAGLWGLGHAGALLSMGVAVLAFGLGMPPAVAHAFEGLVGIMLIVLGADVLRRLRSRRVHFHTHRHGDGMLHFHAHAHDRATVHVASTHVHEHPATTVPRAVVVGSIHGLAGSAALMLVALGASRSTAEAVLYLVLFGVGSIVGMCALSLAISLPLRRVALGGATQTLERLLGVCTIALGSWITVSALVAR